MDKPIPDFSWYSSISRDQGLPSRCPFASVEGCPRYYESLHLLGFAGSTKIDPREDERLLRMWKKSDLWPRTTEQAAATSGPADEPKYFHNFCPEVAYLRFSYFASYLGRYADEIDIGLAHERLRREGAPQEDPRWAWSSVRPMHYAECPLYSPLAYRAGSPTSKGESPAVTLGIPGLNNRLPLNWREAVAWLRRLVERTRTRA